MRIDPFEVGDLRFVHVLPGTDEYKRATQWFHQAVVRALGKRKKFSDVEYCPEEDGDLHYVFSVTENGQFAGTWTLYKVRSVEGHRDRLVCHIGPMLKDVIQDPPDLTRVRAVSDWLLKNGLSTDDRRTLEIEKILLPEDDGSRDTIEQHRWKHEHSRLDSSEVDSMKKERVRRG